ncbi:hypothetical protein WJX81_004061 [Elliptochloris bilobata]|uniref:Dynamin N-terminal domain-containing protein n=1 Tax=Elliptochloris bilobata TaxID=381761 RepID=A0AAW1SIQ6_9CHLO
MGDAQLYHVLHSEVTRAIDEVGRFLGRLVEGPAPESGPPAHQLCIDRDIQRFFTSYYTLRAKHADEHLNVAVLALTKSGKSTLLNALLGSMLLPSSNVPETARITRITHTPLTEGQPPRLIYTTATGESREILGEYAIREHLRFLNREVRARTALQSDEAFLDVQAPLAALAVPAAGALGQAPSGSRATLPLCLLDTPGPNEAGEEGLRFQVERLLGSVDAAVYLLDYTKLKTVEEASLFAKLKAVNPALIRRLSQRLFFVVNKVDLIDRTEGLDHGAIREYVAHLVTSQLGDSGFQLCPEQVLLLSAQDAMLARIVLSGRAGKEERMRFGKLAFGARRAHSTLEAEYQEAAADVLAESGVAELEARVRNVAAASFGALRQDVAALAAEVERLGDELTVVLGSFDELQRDVAALEGEVTDEVRGRMHQLKQALFDKVATVLDPARAPSGADAPVPPAVSSGRWRAVFEKGARFWSRAGGARGAEQRAEVQRQLEDLHADIQGQIGAEVREFWHELEAATNARQAALFKALNRQLERLARRIEATVGDALDVQLEPAAMAIAPPTPEQFHADLRDLFSAAFSPREEARTRTREERHVQWEQRRRRTGLCSFSNYYVGRPTMRVVEEAYSETVFELQPDQIKEYFIRLVDTTVETSVAHVRDFVRRYLEQRLADARARIGAYGSRYANAMLTALDTSRCGEAARQAAVASVGGHLRALDAMLVAFSAVEERVTSLLPPEAAIPALGKALSLTGMPGGPGGAAVGPDLLDGLIAEADARAKVQATGSYEGSLRGTASGEAPLVDTLPAPVAGGTSDAPAQGEAAVLPPEFVRSEGAPLAPKREDSGDWTLVEEDPKP